jgi:hypothetical protein
VAAQRRQAAGLAAVLPLAYGVKGDEIPAKPIS